MNLFTDLKVCNDAVNELHLLVEGRGIDRSRSSI
jgi:hypothetical protein